MNRLVLTIGALALLAPAVLARQDRGGSSGKMPPGTEQDKDKEKEKKEQEKNNPAPVPGWNPDLVTAFAEARKTGKPVMVVFR